MEKENIMRSAEAIEWIVWHDLSVGSFLKSLLVHQI